MYPSLPLLFSLSISLSLYLSHPLFHYHSVITHCFLCRSFAKPPPAVQTVCECIVVLKGLKEVSWKSAKGMMSDPSFLRQLKELDVDNITTKQTGNVKCRSTTFSTKQKKMYIYTKFLPCRSSR